MYEWINKKRADRFVFVSTFMNSVYWSIIVPPFRLRCTSVQFLALHCFGW